MIHRPLTAIRSVRRRSAASSLTAGVIIAALALAPAGIAQADEAAVPADSVSVEAAPVDVTPVEEAPPVVAAPTVPAEEEPADEAPVEATPSPATAPDGDEADEANSGEDAAGAAGSTPAAPHAQRAAVVEAPVIGVPSVTVREYAPGNAGYENAITVDWTAVPEAESYDIRIVSNDGRVTMFTAAYYYYNNSYSLWSPEGGTIRVSVAASVGGVRGEFSAPVSYTPANHKSIDPPTNVSVTTGEGTIDVTFDANASRTSYAYYVALKSVSTGEWSDERLVANMSDGQSASYSWSTTPGVAYDVVVWASTYSAFSPYVYVRNQSSGILPSAPDTLLAEAGDATASLEWTAPDQGSAPITGYDVQYSSVSGVWTSAPSVSAAVATLTGLSNGTVYTARVRAVSVVGASGWTTTEAFTPAGVPLTPASLVVEPSSNQLNVEWDAADGNGADVTSYDVEWRPVGSRIYHRESVTGTTAELFASNGTSYDVRVRAINAIGKGEWATHLPVAVVVAPEAPRNPWANGSNNALTVGWDAPSDNGGSDVVDYEVSWVRSGMRVRSVSPADSGSVITTETEVTISGLVNVTEYDVVVRARTSAGWGAYTSVVTATPFTFEPTFTAADGSSLTGVTLKAGDTVVMSGVEGLPGEDIGLELHSKPISLGTSTIAADGSYSITATIPKNAPGGAHRLFGWIGIPTSIINSSVSVTIAAAVVPADLGTLVITGVDERLTTVGFLSALGLLVAGSLLVMRARRRTAVRAS